MYNFLATESYIFLLPIRTINKSFNTPIYLYFANSPISLKHISLNFFFLNFCIKYSKKIILFKVSQTSRSKKKTKSTKNSKSTKSLKNASLYYLQRIKK